jgi:N-acetylmuramoyl-L-alanine amidase
MSQISPATTVIIDAGHGGEDGGAVAADGTLEKDINLKIAITLGALMKASGYEVILTRDSDVMLDTPDKAGSAKMRDLKRRLQIASEHSDAVTVSIHCNKFPQSSCKGMQVYHSDSDVAVDLAQSVQKSCLTLMPDNHRKIKKADSSIYLLHRAVTPSILVECGFLSNEGELQSLKNEIYQKKLALIIFSGIDVAYKI